MSLEIGTAIREGVDRLTSRNALTLFLAFFLVGILSTVATQSLNVAAQESLLRFAQANAGSGNASVPPDQIDLLRQNLQQTRASSPFAVDVSAAVAFLLAFGLAFVAEGVHVVAIRTFVSDVTDGIPGEFVRRNLPLAVLNGFVGGVVVAVMVSIGLVFVLVPGVFLYVSFLFLRQEIAVEDKNFVDAMADSWALSKGERFELFGLVVVLLFVSLVALAPSVVTSILGVDPLVTGILAAIISPVVGLFGVAVVSRAYVQLREDRADEPDEEDEVVGALGPDDLPEP